MRTIKKFELFESDEPINEAYPEILKSLDKYKRNELSQSYGVGPNSVVTEIDKADATKKAFQDAFLVYVDSSGKPIAYGRGTYVNVVNYNRRRGPAPTRKQLIDASAKIYKIDADPDVKTKMRDRSDAKSNTQDQVVAKNFGNRSDALIDKYETALMDKLSELKAEYTKILTASLDGLEARIKAGDVYDVSSVLGKSYDDAARTKKDIESKIAKIGNIFWLKKSWVKGHNRTPEDVAKLSKEIKAALA